MDPVLTLPLGDEDYHLRPQNVIALGLNYRSHIAESDKVQVRGFDSNEPTEPILFPKLPGCIIGPDQAIVLPEILGDYHFPEERTDYEGELAVILKTGGSRIPVEEALSHVMGYTCANDVSQRNIQNADRAGWFRGKSFDTFLPLGPRIVPAEQIPDVQALSVVTRLNGTVVQAGSTAQMIFPVAEMIAFISRNFTLYPGDIILTGTPAGVGAMKDGDIVEVEIEGIGTLRNPVKNSRS